MPINITTAPLPVYKNVAGYPHPPKQDAGNISLLWQTFNHTASRTLRFYEDGVLAERFKEWMHPQVCTNGMHDNSVVAFVFVAQPHRTSSTQLNAHTTSVVLLLWLL